MHIIKLSEISLPADAALWLQELPGPIVVEVEGRDKSQWRAVSVLVHGNEPSGFFAAFKFLKEKVTPATNLAIIISSVRAARHLPVFSQRHVSGEFDLNRRFGIGEYHDSVTELADGITRYIRQLKPSMLVDLHNTSGKGPAFSVSVDDHKSKRQLASVFTNVMVVTRLVVGSLMEQDFGCPTITIECGGSKERASHEFAYRGLTRFALIEQLHDQKISNLNIYYHPTRIETCSGISLDYLPVTAEHARDHFLEHRDDAHENEVPRYLDRERHEVPTDVDIALVDDIEKYNSTLLPAGTSIGLLRRSLAESLSAFADNGQNIIDELFYCEEHQLIARYDLKVFMATKRADIAISDCLFYAIKNSA